VSHGVLLFRQRSILQEATVELCTRNTTEPTVAVSCCSCGVQVLHLSISHSFAMLERKVYTGFWYVLSLTRVLIEACTDGLSQSSASATGCIAFILGPMFIQPQYRSLRAITYLSLGLFAIVFILHSIYLHGFALQRRRLSIEWMGLMALLNFLGCSAYAFRVSRCFTYYKFGIFCC
jgi:hypothetical protein